MEHVARSSARAGPGRLLWIGPVAFFIAACTFSALDANFSTDTWIGLAAGRQLLEQLDWSRFHETFPRLDTFSYPFYGQPWFNQNWLTHLGQYWLYERIGPAAVVCDTWALVACTHVLVLLTVYWRTGSWLAAWLAAAVAGVGTRDFLEPRAATVGLLCLAATWALVCAIESQGSRRRWWPIAALLPLLLFWTSAHGGFVFGYALLALYVGYWLAARMVRAGDDAVGASGAQMIGLAAVVAVSIVAAVWLGPFGSANFVHPGKVASSSVFRSVTEWHPAYSRIGDVFPSMWRFWGLLGCMGCAVLALWLAGRRGARAGAGVAVGHPAAAAHWTWFDAAVVLAALGMTLWARRFAPLFYVLAAPVVAAWVLRLAAPLPPQFHARAVPALKIAAALAAVATCWFAWSGAQRAWAPALDERPPAGLLERTRGDPALHEAVRFLRENQLRVNLFADYGDGGSVMFYAPQARVFMDGRSEQLYSEAHFRKYLALIAGSLPPRELLRTLDVTRTDAVLLRRRAATTTLRAVLQSAPDWTLVLLDADNVLFLRQDSPALRHLGGLVREGREWRPTRAGEITPHAQASRATVLLHTSPADPAQALALLEGAVDREVTLGHTFYPVIARLVAETASAAAAIDYLSAQEARLKADTALDPQTRAALLAVLAESRRRLGL